MHLLPIANFYFIYKKIQSQRDQFHQTSQYSVFDPEGLLRLSE